MKTKKNTKIKILMASFLCAAILSIGSFALIANAQNNENISGQQSRFKNTAEETTKEESTNGTANGALPKSGKFHGGMFINSDDIAAILGITEDELKTKIEEADGNIIKILEDAGKLDEYKAQILADCKTKLDEQVAAGKMTQEEADARYAETEAAINGITSENMPAMKFDFGSGNVEFSIRGKQDKSFDGEFFGFNFSDIASTLGMTEDEFKTKLEAADGNIIKVLEDAGKLDEYKAQILADCKTKLDEQVAAGKMTQEEADERYAETEMMVNAITDENMPGRRFDFGFSFGGERDDSGFGMGMGIDIHMGGMKGVFGAGDVKIADILGITEDELKTKLEAADGNIMKVLEDAGKLGEYKAQILADCKTKLDEQVAAGKITREEADAAYAKMQESVNNITSENSNFKMFDNGRDIKSFRNAPETGTNDNSQTQQTSL